MIEVVIDAMIAERTHRGDSSIAAAGQHSLLQQPPPPLQQLDSSPLVIRTAPPSVQSATSVKDRLPSPPPANQATTTTTPDTPQDAGVSDEIWQRLQQDKAAAQAQEQEFLQLLEQEAQLQAALDQANNEENKRLHETSRLQRQAHEALQQKCLAEEVRCRQEAQAQKKLQEMGVCCAGFRWVKQLGWYRCAGGAHWVGDEVLGLGEA